MSCEHEYIEIDKRQEIIYIINKKKRPAPNCPYSYRINVILGCEHCNRVISKYYHNYFYYTIDGEMVFYEPKESGKN